MTTTGNFHKHAIALAMVQMLMPTAAQAATINVDDDCSLREAIISANDDSQENGCEQGNGHDTINLVPNSLIELTAVDVLGDGDSGTPIITSEITINGNNSTLARESSAPNMRLLEVVEGGNLTVDSLTLTGGKNKRGTAIYAVQATSLVLTNSVVAGNSAGNAIGAGIGCIGTNTYIKASQIYDNRGSLAAGIYVSDAHLDLLNSDVSANVNTQRHSGVYVAHGSLTMSESTVSSNTGKQQGGLVINSPTGAVNISDSHISGNSSTYNLAGVLIYGEASADITVSNTTINGNMAAGEVGFYLYTYSAGATNSQLSISDTYITNNIVTSGRHIAGLYVKDRNTLLLEDSVVSGNQSNGGAGVIIQSAVNYQPSVTIRNTDITNNDSQYGDVTSTPFINEAGFYVSNSPAVLLDDVRITQNRAINPSGVWAKASTVTITDSQIENNYSISADHSPIRFADSTIVLRDTSVAGNSSTYGHGAVLISGSGSDVSIVNSTLSNNTAETLAGSALQVDSADSVTIANSTISGNTGFGAAVVISGTTNLSITNATLANNQYASGAGGIDILAQPTVFSINNTVFADNSTSDCAAALSFTGSNNWFQDASCTGTAQGSAQLDALADNGGSTLTHALVAMSPLIDMGDTSICNSSPILGLDQRGERRRGDCDIGAYELVESSFFVIPTKQGGSVVIEL